MAVQTGVRDRLARERTDLANERTFLAYLRTSLAFLLSGGFILRFETSNFMTFIAVLLLISGIGIGIFGAKRFVEYKKKIESES